MPYFLLVPVWLVAVIAGLVMLCMPTTRRAGLYLVTISTFAALVSFVLSTGVLVIMATGVASLAGWVGVAFVIAYFTAIPIGALIGAIAGYALTRRALDAVAAPTSPK